jgi:aconitase A
MNIENAAVVSLYVVKSSNGHFFAGFDSAQNKATFVSEPINAKKFTNKYDIKLRPEETLVELTVDLSKVQVVVSEPFRPHRRIQRAAGTR